MYRPVVWLRLWICLLLCGAACSFAGPRELVQNGQFDSAGDPPKGWFRDPATASKGRLSVAAGVLELAPTGENTPSNKPLGLGQAIDASALAGKTLTLSARLGLREPASAAVVGLHALRENGSEIGAAEIRLSRPRAELEAQSATLTIPAQERPKLLILFVVAEGLGGAARFASLSVVDAQAALPAPTAAAAAAAGGGEFAARVSVDANHIERTIPRALFGVNIEWWRNGNGLWDDRNDRVDPGFDKLVRELGPPLIRFPGGFLADTYDWHDGVGPRANRAPVLAQPGTQERYVPYFGTDELHQLASSAGADLLLTVNAGTGSAQMAADWVSYLQSVRKRYPSGPRVLTWEIGNEIYHQGDASGGALSPEAYADKLHAFATAMRAVDPAARIAAIGGVNYPTFPFISRPDWTSVVLQRAGKDIDTLAVHNGYAPVVPDERADPRGVYQALWAAPLMVADNLAQTVEQIRRYAPPAKAETIGIAVTEWAPLFHIQPSSGWVDHSKTLGSAVYVADLLRVLIQNKRVESATFFKLNEASFLGLLGVREGRWIANATYFAMELFTRHFGTSLVSSSADSPSYDSPKAGIVPAMKQVPLLSAVASLSADRSRLFVILVNKSLDQTAKVDLSFNGFKADAATAHLLTGPSPDANTGSELPKVPGLKWAQPINVGPGRWFDKGNPSEISFTSQALSTVGGSSTYRLPPHSVVSLELRTAH